MLRFAITWLVKWYSGIEFKRRYLRSQIAPTPAKRNIRKIKLINSLNLVDTMIEKYSLYNSVLLFLFKTIYFNTGFSEVLSHSRYEDYKRRFIPETRNNRVCYYFIISLVLVASINFVHTCIACILISKMRFHAKRVWRF